MLKFNRFSLKYKPETIPNSVGIVCFHKKDWRTGKNKSPVNIVYLLKTLSSISPMVNKVFLYVSENGMNFIESFYENVEVKVINVPKELDDGKEVYPVGKYGLQEKSWLEYDYVFFTESDQIIYSKNLYNYIKNLSEYEYLSPHRLQHTLNKNDEKLIVAFDYKNYIVCNNFKSELIDLNGFIIAKTFRSSYGAAWIAKKTLLKKIDFNKFPDNALHAPCRALFENSKALKTKNVFDFFVDHLSGFDKEISKIGHSIKYFPGLW